MSALRDGATDLWLAGPALIALVSFVFLPVLVIAVLSFSDYQFGARNLEWIGFDNYSTLFSSSTGRRAIINTMIYAGAVIPISFALALALAVALHRMSNWAPWLSRLFRTIYFLPVAATLVAMSVAWQMVLHPSLGIVNHLISDLGGTPRNWLSDRGLVLGTLIGIGVWQSVGYNLVLFLAGLATIPADLYDAAEIDGAGGAWSRFWTVTWPLLGPTSLFVLVVTATSAFKVFETVATLTDGGPAFASDVLVYAIYREGFVYFKAGYASALTMVFFAMLLALTLLQLRVVEKRVHYQ